MKPRLTPLNIVTALATALLIISFFQTNTALIGQIDASIFYKSMLFILILVMMVSDMIFRFTLKDLKKIWVVELVCIALMVILFLILQK